MSELTIKIKDIQTFYLLLQGISDARGYMHIYGDDKSAMEYSGLSMELKNSFYHDNAKKISVITGKKMEVCRVCYLDVDDDFSPLYDDTIYTVVEKDKTIAWAVNAKGNRILFYADQEVLKHLKYGSK